MLQGPVLEGTTSFEYTFPGSLHCSFKINDTKENSTKHIKKQTTFQTFSTQTHTHTHRHITRQQICRSMVGASIFAIYSAFRSFRSGLWECFPGTKSARELISTCTNELKIMMSSNFRSDKNWCHTLWGKNQISCRETATKSSILGATKTDTKVLILRDSENIIGSLTKRIDSKRLQYQKPMILTPPHWTTPNHQPRGLTSSTPRCVFQHSNGSHLTAG